MSGYTVTVSFKDKSTPLHIKGVTRVCCLLKDGDITLDGEEMLKYEYSFNTDYRVYTDNSVAIISSGELRAFIINRDETKRSK